MEARILCSANVIIGCAQRIFYKKNRDYGTSWRILRPLSVTDQIFIKTNRISTVLTTGNQRVNGIGDDIKSEYLGMINYSIIGIMQSRLPVWNPGDVDVPFGEIIELYSSIVNEFNIFFENVPQIHVDEIEKSDVKEFIHELERKMERLQAIQRRHSEKEMLVLGSYEEIIMLAVLGYMKLKAL